MEGYLGEKKLSSLEGTPFERFGPKEWALEFIAGYGQTDGDHHKAWVMDQITRILLGTPVNVKLARWENGEQEYRFSTGEPSQAYLDWVEEMLGENDEEFGREYSYDVGIAP